MGNKLALLFFFLVVEFCVLTCYFSSYYKSVIIVEMPAVPKITMQLGYYFKHKSWGTERMKLEADLIPYVLRWKHY